METLDQCRYTVSVRNADKWLSTIINKGVIFAELLICSQTPLKVAGLAQCWNQSTSIQELVEEISLEHSKLTYTKPEYRLMIAVAALVAELHTMNTAREQQQAKQLAENMAKAGKDL